MNNIKALKNSTLLILLLVTLGMTSCVSKVSIPDDEKPMFVIDLQMLRGSDNIYATVQTTNTLNGRLYPIERPEDVIIKVQELEVDNFINFVYNSERGVYEYSASEDVITPNTNFVLTTEIPGSDIPKVTARTKVPMGNKLVGTELIEDKEVLGDDGKTYWQGTIRFNFENLNRRNSLFYQLKLNQKLQTKSSLDGEVEYITISHDLNPVEIVNVSSGQFAVKEFEGQDGLWIDLDQLGDDEYFEIEIKSSFPIEYDGQTSDNIFANVVSITEDHYNYYLGLSNINSSNTTLFNEKGLYRSNIDRGVGIFSTCVETNEEINLAK